MSSSDFSKTFAQGIKDQLLPTRSNNLSPSDQPPEETQFSESLRGSLKGEKTPESSAAATEKSRPISNSSNTTQEFNEDFNGGKKFASLPVQPAPVVPTVALSNSTLDNITDYEDISQTHKVASGQQNDTSLSSSNGHKNLLSPKAPVSSPITNKRRSFFGLNKSSQISSPILVVSDENGGKLAVPPELQEMKQQQKHLFKDSGPNLVQIETPPQNEPKRTFKTLFKKRQGLSGLRRGTASQMDLHSSYRNDSQSMLSVGMSSMATTYTTTSISRLKKNVVKKFKNRGSSASLFSFRRHGDNNDNSDAVSIRTSNTANFNYAIASMAKQAEEKSPVTTPVFKEPHESDVLFPKSLDIKEVTSIVQIERQLSTKRSDSTKRNRSSIEVKAKEDGMTIEFSKESNEPPVTLKKTNSILKKKVSKEVIEEEGEASPEPQISKQFEDLKVEEKPEESSAEQEPSKPEGNKPEGNNQKRLKPQTLLAPEGTSPSTPATLTTPITPTSQHSSTSSNDFGIKFEDSNIDLNFTGFQGASLYTQDDVSSRSFESNDDSENITAIPRADLITGAKKEEARLQAESRSHPQQPQTSRPNNAKLSSPNPVPATRNPNSAQAARNNNSQPPRINNSQAARNNNSQVGRNFNSALATKKPPPNMVNGGKKNGKLSSGVFNMKSKVEEHGGIAGFVRKYGNGDNSHAGNTDNDGGRGTTKSNNSPAKSPRRGTSSPNKSSSPGRASNAGNLHPNSGTSPSPYTKNSPRRMPQSPARGNSGENTPNNGRSPRTRPVLEKERQSRNIFEKQRQQQQQRQQQRQRGVKFSSRITLFETYNADDYDRHPEVATCNQLTPLLAQQIREELNTFKSQMPVHQDSRCYTHYF